MFVCFTIALKGIDPNHTKTLFNEEHKNRVSVQAKKGQKPGNFWARPERNVT